MHDFGIILQSVSTTVGDSMISKLGEWSTALVLITYFIVQYFIDRNKTKKYAAERAEFSKLYTDEFKRLSDISDTIYQQLQHHKKTFDDILNCLKITSMQYSDHVSETQMKIIVEKVFESTKYNILTYAVKILKENHIDANPEFVKSKLKEYIDNRYNEDNLAFKEYYFRGDTMEKELSQKITSDIYNVCVDAIVLQKSEKSLRAILDNKFNKYKNQMISKLLSRDELI